MRELAAATILLVGAVSLSSAAEPRGRRILDLTSYWRSYYVLRPARTSEKLWKTTKLPTAGRSGKRWAAWDKAGRDWNKLAEHYKYLGFQFCGHMGSSALVRILSTPAPPAGWEQAGFNDSSWPRMRYPLLMNAVGEDGMGTWNAFKFGLAQACFRARFSVPDPARVGKLTLALTYRGGARVWVNGQEIGRGHLPAGKITPETGAEPYPENAYTLPPGAGYTKGSRCITELKGAHQANYAKWGYDGGGRGYYRVPMTPEEWKTVKKRRNRVLGPITIPAKLLRKGVNTIAVQVVRADLNPIIFMSGNTKAARLGANTHYGWNAFEQGASWFHCCLVDFQLRAGPAGAVLPEARPEGVQLWADDPNRRVFAAEFGDPGKAARVLRMVGARGGTYSAQLVVGTSRELRGLEAEAGDLTGPGGARIPAGALRVRYARPRTARDIALMGSERGNTGRKNPLDNENVWLALWRYGQRNVEGQLPYKRRLPYRHPNRAKNRAALEAAMKKVFFFDELASEPPAGVPADSCQPVWLTVKIPAKTPAGLYTGAVKIRAAGMKEENIPVRVYVSDWKLPDPTRKGQDFSTMVLAEQSPWGVAKAHKVKPWSDEHFRCMEGSLKLMQELGNDYLIVPVLLWSEFGNRDDSFVVWVKGRDGKLRCDFSRFDRYMDLVQKYMPRPRVVCFGVAHAYANYMWVEPKVLVRDEATGKTSEVIVPLGHRGEGREGRRGARVKDPTPEMIAEARAFWKPFVEGVLSRMKKRGLEKSVFWGYAWDHGVMAYRYQGVFDQLAPEVEWARGLHGHGGVTGKQGLRGPFGCVGTIVCLPQPVRKEKSGPNAGKYVIHSHKGWKTELFSFALPRVQNAVLCVEGRSVPFMWRIFPELSLAQGARGICRIGLDFWDWTWADGWRGGGQVGLGVKVTVWSGKKGTNSSARFEMLREGMQEAECRVFLEKRLERRPDAAVQKLLDDRIQATLHIPRSFYFPRMSEQFPGWQGRSWDLYAACARAAGGRAPSAAEREKFFGPEP